MKNISKLDGEIEKMKLKITDYTARLKELEREKTEAENFEIVAMVRQIDASPENLKAFMEAYKQKFEGAEHAPGKEQNET